MIHLDFYKFRYKEFHQKKFQVSNVEIMCTQIFKEVTFCLILVHGGKTTRLHREAGHAQISTL